MDLVVIDADKDDDPAHLDWAVRLSRGGSVTIADNVVRGGHIVHLCGRAKATAAAGADDVVRGGQIIHASSGDAGAHGMYDFNRRAADDGWLGLVILPNRNGRDGILIAVVR